MEGTSRERETDGAVVTRAHLASHLPLVNKQSLTDTLGEAWAKRGPWSHPCATSVPLGEFWPLSGLRLLLSTKQHSFIYLNFTSTDIS